MISAILCALGWHAWGDPITTREGRWRRPTTVRTCAGCGLRQCRAVTQWVVERETWGRIR